MNVYRLCKEKEVQNILENKSLDSACDFFMNNSRLSSFEYDSNTKYLHFFKDYDSLFYIGFNKNEYVCTYDIPIEVLEKNKGYGIYLDRCHFTNREVATEYAIPSEELDYSYLIKIDKAIKSTDFEEFIYNDYSNNLLTIYEREKNNTINKVKTLNRG